MSSRRSAAASGLFLALLGSAGAAPARAQAGGGLATFLDAVEVRVVNVDVLVLDAEGRPVTDLARDDFELLEDGKPVEITNFASYDEGSGAGASPPLAPGAAAPAEGTPRAPRAAPPPTWIVYLDQSLLQPGPRNQVARETRAFLERALAPESRSMVATFDGQSLKFLSPLSPDRALALDALARLEKQAGLGSGLRGRLAQIQNQILGVDPASQNAAIEAESLLRDIEAAAEEQKFRQRAALDAFRDLLAIVAGVEGRVALLFAAGGFESNPAETTYRVWESKFRSFENSGAMPMRDRNPSRLAEFDWRALLEPLDASRVTVYSIFAGEGPGPSVSAELGGDPGAAGPSPSITDPEAGASLATLAASTGGRSFVGAPGLAERLETARRELATYYSLGYRPDSALPGTHHEITVRVRRAGLKVVHRRGVTERSADQVAGDSATAALLASGPPENPFGAQIEVGSPAPAKRGRGRLLPVTVRVPLRALTLLPDGAVHRAQLSFHFSLRAPDGGYRRLEPRPLEFRVANEKLAASLGQSVAFQVDLAVEPGAYQLAVGVVDELGGATSAATAGFEVAKNP